MYNSLPKYLRENESDKTKKFKFQLYKFLELIPDETKMPSYVTAARSNSILDQLSHRKFTEVTMHGDGFIDSALEQA